MPRYLLFFSYIGSNFRGCQRLLTSDKTVDTASIQGLIETHLGKLWSDPAPKLKLSSRTDKGVHAFINAAHFNYEQSPFTPEEIVKLLNRSLRNDGVKDLCILKACAVPEDLHARRSVKSRSYMYRIAVLNDEVDVSHCAKHRYQSLLPLVEQQRCCILRPGFDFKAFDATMNLFKGQHDFSSFMASRSHQPPERSVVKIIDLQVVPGQPFLNLAYDPLYENLQFYEVHLHSKSFLYQQIRRMVGAAIAVGYGRAPMEEVRFILENPEAWHWNPNMIPAPPEGLFLTRLMYDALDFEFPK